MEGFVDHYLVLGLPSGEEATLKLSEKEILKAYKLKALVVHPDKRPDDPDAHEKFQRLWSSYEVLKDENTRKVFDDVLRVQREKQEKKTQVDSKRRKMMSDLEERERSSHAARGYDEEARIARKLKEVVDGIRAKYAKKRGGFETSESCGVDEKRKEDSIQLDKERVLKVSWGRIGEGYTVGKLREVFKKFGGVEDVVIRRSTKKKCSALIVMATKDEAVSIINLVFLSFFFVICQ